MSGDDIDRAMRAGKPLTAEQAARLTERNAMRLKAARERKVKEGNIRKLLDTRVKVYGGETRAVAWLGRKYAPDVLCLFPGGSLYTLTDDRDMYDWTINHPFVETKRPGKGATEAQAREHERMRAAGCVVMVITTEAELDAWLPPL